MNAMSRQAAIARTVELYRSNHLITAEDARTILRGLGATPETITSLRPVFEGCAACGDKHYLIATRDDGHRAIERCDSCSGDPLHGWLTDMDAAKLAQADGIECSDNYPCYLKGESR